MEEENYKFLTVYGPSGFTSFCSIKLEIEPFKAIEAKSGQEKPRDKINVIISSAAGGIGLTVAEYLVSMGYKNVYGIAGS